MISLDYLLAALVLVAVQLRICAPLMTRRTRAVLAVLVFVWAMLPWPWGLAGWLLSYLAGFSIATGLLALLAIQHRIVGHYWLPVGQLRAVCIMLVLMALWFYPMSLGSSYVDPYALGFGNFGFATVLLLVGLFAWVCRAYATCVVLVLVQGAFALDLLHTDNLWDYLMDPWLVCWALGWLIRDRILAAGARLPEEEGEPAAPAQDCPLAARAEGQ
ncbi:hypothetical protein A11A3_02642 [Alcanivorax hongdengensis A-11-3]|uniref:Uncharacterized protein n=1 Tax=Alcanivorax hongdengensis A-11-3 TaxID=1177179 RepID=L0WFB6_9GAMM|nr:hypothetical protein [Alcanivorax hongdengensis]EKF75731.1 hypothetical protein A11A3_02642 [Alcanivorax hongdengensis A-11-3]